MSYEVVKEEAKFDELIKSGKVIVDFYADWCGPCKMLAPIFEEVGKESNDVKFVKLNVDEIQSAARNNAVTSIPTLILFENGEEVKRHVGFISKNDLIKFATV